MCAFEINRRSINHFIDKNQNIILVLRKDAYQREYLDIKKKNLWIWFISRVLRLKSYQLKTVAAYIKTHKKEFDDLSLESNKNINEFYRILNRKISNYNKHRSESRKISISFIEKIEKIMLNTLSLDSISSNNDKENLQKKEQNIQAPNFPAKPSELEKPIEKPKLEKSEEDISTTSISIEQKRENNDKENLQKKEQNIQTPNFPTKPSELEKPIEKPKLEKSEENISTTSISIEQKRENNDKENLQKKEQNIQTPNFPTKPSELEKPIEKPKLEKSEENISTTLISIEQKKEIKTDLINFYINQQARLMDLKAQLKLKDLPEKKKKILQQAILKIEQVDVQRIKIALEIQLQAKPSMEQVANYLGKSIVTARSFLLGQAYAKVVLQYTPQILNQIMAIDAQKFGEHEATVKKMQNLQHKNFDEMALELKINRQEAADLICDLWAVLAQMEESDLSSLQHLETTIDQEVAKVANITVQEIDQWLQDIEKEKQIGIELTRLGEERPTSYPSNYQQATSAVFEKHQVSSFTNGIWTVFSKGTSPSSNGSQHLWKLFLNPKPSELHSTLDRALQALSSMPMIVGKIISTNTYKRKSDILALHDPCEPKLLFYFDGPNSIENFKRAVSLLEKEFVDADLVGLPKGKREQGHDLKDQWGPSFTKQRNRLMFYTQGGYTESGRNLAVASDELNAQFEGENYYLHKGSVDPLAEIPSPVYSIDKFLADMKANQHLFSQPFHLIKLQNILNKLNKDPLPSTEIKQWKEDIRILMQQISSQMQMSRQAALTRLLENWEQLGDVRNIVAKTFYKDLEKNVEQLDLSKGVIKGKLEYIVQKAQETIDKLESYVNQSDKSSSFDEVLQAIPPSFRSIFMQDFNKKSKPILIDQLIQEITAQAKKNQIELLSNEIWQIRTHLEKNAFIVYKDGQLILSKIDEDCRVEVPCRFDNTLQSAFLDYVPFTITSLLEKTKNDFQKTFSLPPNIYSIGFKKSIEVVLIKIKHVQIRQRERLDTVEKGQPVIIPQYFHATTEAKVGSSIAKTGIEALIAASGFGAFISTQPEFRYGYLTLGLPRNIEFDSKAMTKYNRDNAPHIIKSHRQVWVGLENLISVNPGIVRLKQKFSSAIQQAIFNNTHLLDNLPNEMKFKLEEALLQNFNRSVVFRFVESNDSNSRWSLHWRFLNPQPVGVLRHIQTNDDFNYWASEMIDSAIDTAKIPSTQKNSLKTQLLNNFQISFKQAYYERDKQSDDYTVQGQLGEKIKACVIAPDDDLKEFYQLQYQQMIKVKDNLKPMQTLSEVEAEFTKVGLGKNVVEFIPLSEQLIERDFLLQADAKIPQAW